MWTWDKYSRLTAVRQFLVFKQSINMSLPSQIFFLKRGSSNKCTILTRGLVICYPFHSEYTIKAPRNWGGKGIVVERSAVCVPQDLIHTVRETTKSYYVSQKDSTVRTFQVYLAVQIFSKVNSKRWSEVAQSCLTLCDPVDCSLSGSSIHGIFQTRILEWGAISFSRGSSWPRDWTQVSRIAGKCFMAPHSSTLAWRIPGTGEPGGLPSVGSHRVGHDWSDLAVAAAALPSEPPGKFPLVVASKGKYLLSPI